MGKDRETKERARGEGAGADGRIVELERASADVLRLRRELTEAEARRDAVLLKMLAPGSRVATEAAEAGPRTVVVRNRYMAFVETLRGLRSPFDRSEAVEATRVKRRTASQYLGMAFRQGILRRVRGRRYEFVQAK